MVQATRTGVVFHDPDQLYAWLFARLEEWRQGQPLHFAPDEEILSRFTVDHQMDQWRTFLLHHAPAR